MAVTFRYVGWSAFEITVEDGRRVLVDPFLAGHAADGVPPSPISIDELATVDVVVVTHVAADHLGQAFEILHRGQALLVCDVSTRFRAEAAGIDPARIYYMVPGVRLDLGGIQVKALAAVHLSFAKLGEDRFISAPPLSYVVTTPGGVRVFLGGDTAITSDHQLYGQLYKPDVAILGVGGVNVHGQSLTELYPDEAALVAKWLGVKVAMPIHYRFDEGAVFAKELKKRAPKAKAVVMNAGESYRLGGARARASARRPRRAGA